ncbi:MAG: lamin tail domain-containing protein [Bacteroidales bacterium]|nr:lamin tail domain-containing protein [Bacteroidales bacterium]
MNLRKSFLIFLVGLLLTGITHAQYSSDLRLNEVQALNEKGPIDQFGDHAPWVEIFNTAYNSINMAGLYLSNDPKNLTLYKLPNDVRFKISQRSYLVFYCDGNSNKSTFHCNFKLDTSGVVYLTDGDGVTIIDSVSYSFTKEDASYLRQTDGAEPWVYHEVATPMQSNEPPKTSHSADNFLEFDPIGIGMAIIAMFVVMTALVLSYLVFKYGSRLYRSDLKKHKTVEEAAVVVEEESISGEVAAAIAMSMHIYVHQMHDLEDTIITIRKISKTYSPWSSKLYMLRPWPQKRN